MNYGRFRAAERPAPHPIPPHKGEGIPPRLLRRFMRIFHLPLVGRSERGTRSGWGERIKLRTVGNRLLLLFALLIATPAFAAQVTVTNAWFRALPAKLPSGGYFTLHNGGAAPITLTGAESPACGMLMLHKSSDMNGMSSMSDVASVPVPAGGTLQFAPGGYHLMCMNPAPAMKPGASVSVTLDFADGTKATLLFAVKNAAGR
jgi:periplasmic copper chaperone A